MVTERGTNKRERDGKRVEERRKNDGKEAREKEREGIGNEGRKRYKDWEPAEVRRAKRKRNFFTAYR